LFIIHPLHLQKVFGVRLPNPNFQASNDDFYAVERLSYQSRLIPENLGKTKGYGLTFAEICDKLLIKEAVRVQRREFASRSLVMLKSRLSRHVLPYFGPRLIDQINPTDIEEFLTYLYEFDLSDITINQYFNALRKVLTHAFELELIDKLPRFPKLKLDSIPRGGFTIKEYLKILRYSKNHREKDSDLSHPKTHRDTQNSIFTAKETVPFEFAWLIGFMVNSFVRPVDIKLIQHQHVEIIRGKYIYLRLTLPETKKHRSQIVTLYPAVRIYEKLYQYMKQKGLAKPDDYLFLPEVKDREAASYLITKDFRKVLIATGLRVGHLGQNKTLYSLRHTAITNRLLYGKGIDLLTLARNARTSVEMIERFYASQLSPEMNIALLQSRRSL
jgi:site-specific recombinase XerD